MWIDAEVAPLHARLAPIGSVRPWCSAAPIVPASSPSERAVTRRALPEHPEREGREQRRVHEREHELQQIHDVVERAGDVRRRDRQQDPADRRHASHPQVVLVRLRPA